MTRTFEANTAEVLCKVVCHNICCLIQAYFELKLEKAFYTKAQETTKISVII